MEYGLEAKRTASSVFLPIELLPYNSTSAVVRLNRLV